MWKVYVEESKTQEGENVEWLVVGPVANSHLS